MPCDLFETRLAQDEQGKVLFTPTTLLEIENGWFCKLVDDKGTPEFMFADFDFAKFKPLLVDTESFNDSLGPTIGALDNKPGINDITDNGTGKPQVNELPVEGPLYGTYQSTHRRVKIQIEEILTYLL